VDDTASCPFASVSERMGLDIVSLATLMKLHFAERRSVATRARAVPVCHLLRSEVLRFAECLGSVGGGGE
jgi:hypothetical protein